MPPRFASFCQKNGRARRQARRRRASSGRDGPVGTAGACSIVGGDRKVIRYRSCRPPDTELRTQLRDLANERKRFGYRRLFVLLRQEGEPSGINRIYRLYREEGLTVRKRPARRRAVGSRAPILVESKPNARWSVDFVHDQLACGRRLRILNIVKTRLGPPATSAPDQSLVAGMIRGAGSLLMVAVASSASRRVRR
jgi:hypothetical protein